MSALYFYLNLSVIYLFHLVLKVMMNRVLLMSICSSFLKGLPLTLSPSHPLTLTPSSTSPTFPMVIPPLLPGKPTSNGEERGNQATNKAKVDELEDSALIAPTSWKRRPSSTTQKWVTLSISPNTKSVSGGKQMEEVHKKSAQSTHEWVTLPPSPGTFSSESSATVSQYTSDIGVEIKADGGAEELLNWNGHSLSIPHSRPPSANHSFQWKPSGNKAQSLDYDYPFTQVRISCGRLLSRPILSGHPCAASIPSPRSRVPTTMTMSHNANFERDEYVEMTGISTCSQEPKHNEHEYQNWEVVKAMRTQRSQSMEDLHYYKNYPLRGHGGQLTFMDLPTISLPLPPRQMQPGILQCVVPPRNIPRVVPQVESLQPEGPLLPVSPTHHGSLDAPLKTSKHSSATHQFLTEPTAFLPPRTLTQQQQLPSLQEASLGSPPLQMPSSCLGRTPRFPQAPVGTSSWTEDNDPAANYYNVVSKSYFSPPQSGGCTEPTNNHYLDIIPD